MASPPRVLIVDDDDDMLDAEEQALVSKGYLVTRARHGAEALERVAEAEPQLVLLDMNTPVMDGWTFARIIRERCGRRIPIIVVTAAADSQLRANEIGAESSLGKPFTMAALFEAVADVLGEP